MNDRVIELQEALKCKEVEINKSNVNASRGACISSDFPLLKCLANIVFSYVGGRELEHLKSKYIYALEKTRMLEKQVQEVESLRIKQCDRFASRFLNRNESA